MKNNMLDFIHVLMMCINFKKNYTYIIKKELREMYKLPVENLDLNRIDIFKQLVKAKESLGIF
ncbi:hypothetical protein [Fusobacterium nucleatum]